MKIELTRAEIERIVLVYVNGLIPGQHFNTIEGPSSYRCLPETITVSVSEVEDATQ